VLAFTGVLALLTGLIALVAEKGVASVGHIDSGLPSVGLPMGRAFGDYLSAAGSAAEVMLVGFG
jgi:hypothetical protein